MQTTRIKFSTMAISLVAIALGVHLQSIEQAELAFTSHALQSGVRPPSVATPSDVTAIIPTAFEPVVVPGQSVGPVTTQTTYSDLARLFGPSRLANTDVSIGEGFSRPGTHVSLGEDLSFTVVWVNANRTQVREVRNLGPGWRTPEGIQAGMSMEALEKILGPFQLYGFAWDYGGTVQLSGTRLATYEAQLTLRLQPTPADAQETDAFRRVIGDGLFASDHQSFDKLSPVVDEIIVSLHRQDP